MDYMLCANFFISKALNLHIFSAKFHDQFHLPPHKSNFRPSGNFEEKKYI